MKRPTFFLLNCTLFVGSVFCVVVAAAQEIPAGLPPEEHALASLMNLTPSFSGYWHTSTKIGSTAEHQLQRAAVAMHCDALAGKPLERMLDPRYRRAVELVTTKLRAGGMLQINAANFNYGSRAGLWAFSTLSSAERKRLISFGQKSFEREALRLAAMQAVLTDLAGLWGRPLSVVWLKSYFALEGKSGALRNAVGSAAPQLLSLFDKVGAADSHTPDDSTWLNDLTLELSLATPELQEAIAQAFPAEVVNALAEHYEHRFYALRTQAIRALKEHEEQVRKAWQQGDFTKGDPPQDCATPADIRAQSGGAVKNDGKRPVEMPLSDALIVKEIECRFPVPESLVQDLRKFSSKDLAGPEVKLFCPDTR